MKSNKKHKRTVRLRYVKYAKQTRYCGCFLCCGDFEKYLKLKYKHIDA